MLWQTELPNAEVWDATKADISITARYKKRNLPTQNPPQQSHDPSPAASLYEAYRFLNYKQAYFH